MVRTARLPSGRRLSGGPCPEGLCAIRVRAAHVLALVHGQAAERGIAEQYHVPDRQVRAATADEKQAYLDSVSATDLATGAASLAAAGAFLVARRRLERR